MESYDYNITVKHVNADEFKVRKNFVFKLFSMTIVTMCLIVLISINTHASAWFFGEIVKEDGALIRPSTSASSGELGRLPKGAGVKIEKEVVNSKTGNHWYKLYNSDGYIFVDNVKRPSSKVYDSYVSAYVIVDNAKIHDGPYGNMKVTRTGSNGSLCYLSKEYKHVTNNNVWYRIVNKDTGSTLGYIFGDYVRRIKSTTAVNKTFVCTKSSTAVIRKAPADSCPVVGSIEPRQRVNVTYKYVTENGNVWYKLGANKYVFGDYLKEHTSHTWGTGTVTKAPTCTETGTKKANCTLCNATGTATLSALGHNYSNNVCTRCSVWKTSSLKSKATLNNIRYIVIEANAKVHNGPYGACKTTGTLSKGTNIYVTEKVVNAENHIWYKYSGGYIYGNYVKDHSSCKWDSGKTTKSATCTSTGTKTYTCTLCGQTKNSTIAINKSNHSFSKNVCVRCDAWNTSSLKSKTSIDNQKYIVIASDAKVHTGPYGSNKTVKTLKKGTSIIVTQKVVNAENHVWYKYSEGYIFGDYVTSHSSCKWNSGKTTKAATCTSTGTKVYTCTLCGVTKTSKIKAYGHKYDGYVCTRCDYWSDSKLKSKAAVNNVKYVVTADSAKVHTGPYGACKTKTTLKKGATVYAIEKVVNGEGNTWYKLSDGNWVYSGNVTQRFTIKYDANGGSPSPKSKTCLKGNSLTVTADKPTRVGYIFKGWGTSKTTTKVSYKSGSSYKFTKSITLYAVWEKCTDHNYKNNGGICKNCKFEYKSKFTSVDGRVYVKNEKGAAIYSRPYTENSKKIRTEKYKKVLSIVGYCKNQEKETWYKLTDGNWVCKDNVVRQYIVTYDLNGGTGTFKSQKFLSGKSVTISKTKPTLSGYIFLGWDTSKDAMKVVYKPGATYSKKADVTLYAVWSKDGVNPSVPITEIQITDYNAGVSQGKIRYCNQKPAFYASNGWRESDKYSCGGMCNRACESMAFSYIGIDQSPSSMHDNATIKKFELALGFTPGYTAQFYDVAGKSTVVQVNGGYYKGSFNRTKLNDLVKLFENDKGSGIYSPVMVHYDRTINGKYDSHWILLLGINKDGSYQAIGPWSNNGTDGERVKFTVFIDDKGVVSGQGFSGCDEGRSVAHIGQYCRVS